MPVQSLPEGLSGDQTITLLSAQQQDIGIFLA